MTAPAPDLSLADYTDERFTDEQRDKLVTFEAAEEPEEVTVERVARAIRTEWDSWTDLPVESDESSRRLAAAALTALRGDRAPLAGQHTTDEEADRG